MLIQIEGSTVYYFFMFLSIIVVPIFFYCYRLLMRVMHYYAMKGIIEQFALTFRDNEDLIRDASRSVFGLVQRLEEHCYNYYYMTSIGSIVGSIYNSLVNLVSGWFNKNNSCRVQNSDCCVNFGLECAGPARGNYGFHEIPTPDCVYGPNPNYVYAPAPEEYFLQKVASQKATNYNMSNKCSPACQCSPCNCLTCNCSPCNPVACPGYLSTGIPCFDQNLLSRSINAIPEVSPKDEYCPSGCKIDRRTWGDGADIHDKYYMAPRSPTECAEYLIGDWMTRRKTPDNDVPPATNTPNIESSTPKSFLRRRMGTGRKSVRKTLARTRRTPKFYSKNIFPCPGDKKYVVDLGFPDNVPLVEGSSAQNVYVDGVSPETDGIRVSAMDCVMDYPQDCLDCIQNQNTDDSVTGVGQTLNNMFGADVVTNSFEAMMEMADKFDDPSNPSTIDYNNLTLTDVMLELVRIAKDLEFNIDCDSYSSVLNEMSSKLSKYLDNPGPNQKVADFIRLTCYSGLGPDRFMRKYLQRTNCSGELVCRNEESAGNLSDSPSMHTFVV